MKLLRVFLGLLLLASVVPARSLTIAVQPTVTAMTPAPGATLGSPPSSITLTLSAALDPATVTLSTVRLIHGGPDNTLGNGDDVAVVPAGVSVVGGNQIQISLAGVVLPNGPYRVLVSGTPVVDPAPIGKWLLDEGSGAVALDSSGNAHNGTLVNAPSRIAGKSGGALHFDGINQRVDIADNDLFSPHVGPSGEMSVSAWVRLASIPGFRAPLVVKGNDNNWEYALFVYSDAAVAFAMIQSNGVVYAEAHAGTFTTGTWHHLAGTMKKGESVKVWLDGIPVDNRLNFGGDTLNLTAPLRIGMSGPTPADFLDGDVDDVRIFDKELTTAQVMNLATLGNAVRDTAGNVLDGEFAGAFPSGNGAAGGDFSADFTVNVAPLQVTAMTPAPGSNLTSAPADVVLTLSANVDSATVNGATVTLVRAGPDQALGTGDDVVMTPSSISLLTPNQIRLALGIAMPNDLYRVTLSGTTPSIPGRVNYWSMDEGIGPSVADPAGSAPGAIVGPVWRPGRVGNALHYNGISDRVVIGATPLAPPWTAGLWVRREDSPSGDARLMDPGDFSGGTLRLESFNNTNRVGVAIYTVADYPSNYTAPVGQWVHLTFVGSPSSTQLFVNGELQDNLPAVFSTPRYFIGSHGYNTMLGTIDDVQLFGRNLSPTEIRSLASMGGSVRDLNGNRLDGEFLGSLPSGNNAAGGDFAATFAINFPPPPPPSAFTLVSPTNGATGVSRTPTLSWNASTGAASYTVQIALDNGFTSMVANQSGLVTTSFVPGSALSPSTPYFWRVTAVNSGGSTVSTGAPFSFTTTVAAPAAFTLSAPGANSVNISTTPTFTWNSSSGAATYTLEVATDVGFTGLVVNQTGIVGTTATPSVTLANGNPYFWRVTAVNAGGNTVATGSPSSFTTVGSPATDLQVGGCGLTGLEAILFVLLLRARRRIRTT